MKNHSTLWLLLAVLLLYALDQVSKWCIVTWFIPPHPQTGAVMDRLPVLQGNGVLNFDLIHIHNTGVAFGLGNATTWAPYLFLGIQLVALIILVLLYRKGFFNTRLLKAAWVFVMAGVLGNMTDRLLQGFNLAGSEHLGFWENVMNGRVIDFLDFSLPWTGKLAAFVHSVIPQFSADAFPEVYHWPAFNVADSCVCIAAGLFIISSFFFEPDPETDRELAETDDDEDAATEKSEI